MRFMTLILLFALLVSAGTTFAQSGSGQVCVRAYEDRNSNAQLDVGEPLLTRGVSINLLNAEGIIINSNLLENSPTAAQGILCFQQLAAGSYTLALTSADFTVTTASSVPATVSEGGLPAVVEFGARQAAAPTPAPSSPSAGFGLPSLSQGARLVISALGALVTAAVMVVIGLILYAIIFAPRLSRARARDRGRSSGSMRAVPVQQSEME